MHITQADKAVAEKFAFGLEAEPSRSVGGELSEADLLAADLTYHQRKTSGALDRERLHRAVEDQVQLFRCMGAL